MKSSPRIFLDTSVIFSAVLSEMGGARKLFRLGEAGMIQLVVGPNVLRECEEVIWHKVPASLPTLAYLLELGLVEIAPQPLRDLYAVLESKEGEAAIAAGLPFLRV